MRWVYVLLVLSLCSCSAGRNVVDGAPPPSGDGHSGATPDTAQDSALIFPDAALPSPDLGAPCDGCTDPMTCCPKEAMKCYGDPDKGVICTCAFLWDCAKDPSVCVQDIPVPTDADPWVCTWSKASYSCTSADSPDLGAVDKEWSCAQDASQKWTCVKTPSPNPCNAQHGVNWWSCITDPVQHQLRCTKNVTWP